MQCEPEQSEKQTQDGGERHMPASRESSDGESLRVAPSLRARRQHERQPVRRDRRVKKCDGKSGDRDRRENSFIHIRRNVRGA